MEKKDTQIVGERKVLDQLAGRRPGPSTRVEKMAYRSPGTVSVTAQPFVVQNEPTPGAEALEYAASVAQFEQRLRESEERAAAREKQIRQEGQQTLDQLRQADDLHMKAAIEERARQVGAALYSFRAEREHYFAVVEQEVVQLALAIAARILNREASLDPLLLAGAVRVALGQLGETSGVRLRCPMNQLEPWRDLLALIPNRALIPEVIGDVDLEPGDCVLEANNGTVELGVRAQLAEIERGFFDLLEHRPSSRSA
ncbi:Flagellar assembly protein FliH [Acidisarcina polymorpha]|uniref:Flagellar assembly protein FliH n=1 Tax=Acidisarcina polymorpha TaxID=2211140 RepID=A0A2Z5FS09_9BACT|nr:FliH/SctL family protein [Acidisarcina polymorpha]AXC09521.1 Flagellar assembly protein FliH [Acidisarcina polymorpha]